MHAMTGGAERKASFLCLGGCCSRMTCVRESTYKYSHHIRSYALTRSRRSFELVELPCYGTQSLSPNAPNSLAYFIRLRCCHTVLMIQTKPDFLLFPFFPSFAPDFVCPFFPLQTIGGVSRTTATNAVAIWAWGIPTERTS